MPRVSDRTMPGNPLRNLTGVEAEIFEQLKNGKNDLVNSGLETVAKHNLRSNRKQSLLRAIANDIYPIPDCLNPARREECSTSFKLFCEHYFPNRFFMRWSPAHVESLEMMQSAVLRGGGYFALAEPRGNGKTVRAEALALWALLYGYRKFVVCVGATAGSSVEMYKSILTEIETNSSLADDFPEVLYPITCLNGSYLRARSQTCEGINTRLEIRADSLVLPYIVGSDGQATKTSGSAIQCVSITGRIRGIKRTVVNSGHILRPDFVIIDDPQTDRSAKSPRQVDSRERAIVGTILGLAGPQSSITAVMPCTVIASNDLAERFLDHERRPEWQGRKTSMMPSFPTNMDLWKEYAEIQAKSFRNGTKGKEATEFYTANRAEMDAGAVVSWDERYNPQFEVSAVQHAMNLWIKDPKAFAAEYQNCPLIESNNDADRIVLESKEIMHRLSMLPYRTIPRETEYLTCGIDIQKRILYYVVTAWTKNFGGVIADYGTFPRQTGTDYFQASAPPIPMDAELPDLLLGPQIFKGLEWIWDDVFSRAYKRDEGEDTLKIERCLVDANWDLASDAVYSFCKENEAVFHPALGKGVLANMLPMDQWPAKQGEKRGKGWRIRLNTAGGRGRHTIYDTNFWKSRVAERLMSPSGSSNCIKLYGSKAYHHQLLSDHLASEFSEKLTGRGRSVNQWSLKPGGGDNHWFDCLVMSAVGASQRGLELHDITLLLDDKVISAPPAKRIRKFVDLNKL